MFVHLKLEFDNYYLFFTEGENFEEFGHLAYLTMTSTGQNNSSHLLLLYRGDLGDVWLSTNSSNNDNSNIVLLVH
jgi:hypothetical protein